MSKQSAKTKSRQAILSSLKKPPTLTQVAELAGVSRWAAGAILNKGTGNTGCSEEKRKRILEAAKILGYHPNHAARTLRGKQSQFLGIMVASAGDPLRSFLVEYLDAAAKAAGYHVLIGNTIGNPMLGPNLFEQCVVDFTQRKVDGVLCAVNPWFQGDRQFLLDMHPNTVFYDDPGICDASYVTVDRADAIRQSVEHLLAQGKKKIALTLMSRQRETQKIRLAAYREALEKHGLEFCEDLVFFGCDHGADYPKYNRLEKKWTFSTSAIEKALTMLVDKAGVDAIIAYDDFWAATFVKELRKRGKRVPDDVAIIGYLNHYLADWTDPPLTTIDINHILVGDAMVKMLEEMIDHQSRKAAPKRVLVQPQLVIRESA